MTEPTSVPADAATGASEIDVVYVGDDPTTAAEIETALERASGRLAVESMAAESVLPEDRDAAGIDCLVSRPPSDDVSTVSFLDRLREDRPQLPVFLVAEAWTEDAASAALATGATGCLPDSAARDGTRLATRIERAVDRTAERRELEAATARFRAFTENTSFAVLTATDDGVVQYANDAIESIFGYEPADIVGERLTTLIPVKYQDRHREAIARYLRTGERSLDWGWVELAGRHADGHEVPVGISFGEAVVDGEHLFTAVIRDITERTRAEAELEANVAALRALYEISTKPDASLEEKVPELLDLACDYLDLPYGFLTRISVNDRTQTVVEAHGDDPALKSGTSCPLAEAYCRKTIAGDDLLTIANAPEEGWDSDPAYDRSEFDSYVSAKVTVDGTIWGTLCFASSEPRGDEGFSETERTLVKLMAKWVGYETEHQQSHETLERQNERLQEFTSVVSHDLRNPLNVAQGSLDLARAGDDSQLEACEQALERMEQLIEELLSLAEQGATTADLEPVSLRDLATRAWSMVDTGEAALELADDARIRADPDRLQQLLENLFRNALDHGVPDDGTSGDLTVTVGDCGDGFYVADTGRGIPEAERDEVFDVGFTTAEDGTGFGLGIVKRVTDAHDWDLEATASESGGARFEITGVTGPRSDGSR